MHHRKDHRKLSRNTAHRTAMLRNLVTSLFEHEEVRTTTAKAKEVRRVAERMITLGKQGTLAARRRALATIRSKEVAAKVFGDLAKRYDKRPGGYTRQYKVGPRHGDNAEISIIQLVDARKAGGAEANTST
ncbi:MAG: 50S ribosomal protein L17 [Myxococcota bacterium]